MTKFPSGAVTGLFVIAVVAVAAVNTSHASPLADLDNDAWTLERTAIRADRDVRYNFRHAPVANCLRRHLCFIAEKSDELQRTIGRRVNPRELREIEECLNEIDANLEEARQAAGHLRTWAQKGEPVVLRYGGLVIDTCTTGASVRDLQQLGARIELLQTTLRCMFSTLEKLFCECGITQPHAHDRQHAIPGRSTPDRHQIAPGPGRPPVVQPQSSRHRSHRSGSPHRTVTVPIGGSRSRFQLSFIIH